LFCPHSSTLGQARKISLCFPNKKFLQQNKNKSPFIRPNAPQNPLPLKERGFPSALRFFVLRRKDSRMTTRIAWDWAYAEVKRRGLAQQGLALEFHEDWFSTSLPFHPYRPYHRHPASQPLYPFQEYRQPAIR
jgi:hypothetical protein